MPFSLAVYGDSLSTGTHGDGGYLADLRRAGAEPLFLHAVGSSSLAPSAPNSLVDVLRRPGTLHPRLDVALVWLGTNDWYWGTPLGDRDDRDPSTYLGAWHHCVGLLREVSEGLRIVAPTPLWRDELPHGVTEGGAAFTCPNRLGHTLTDYADALVAVAADLDLELVDMTTATGLGAADAEACFEDRVHPNRRGYQVIGPVLARAVTAAARR